MKIYIVCCIDHLFPLILFNKVKVHLSCVRVNYLITNSTLTNREIDSYLYGFPVGC
jgi:hypothetical protein